MDSPGRLDSFRARKPTISSQIKMQTIQINPSTEEGQLNVINLNIVEKIKMKNNKLKLKKAGTKTMHSVVNEIKLTARPQRDENAQSTILEVPVVKVIHRRTKSASKYHHIKNLSV